MATDIVGGDSHKATVVCKRAIDVVVGSALSLLVLPVVIVLALAVALALRANPLFLQVRPGRGNETLRMIKLRTLPPTTPHYASKYDLAIDRMDLPWICSLLRRTHLDELPQLFLVPFGKMSLVGPRPRLPDDVEAVDPSFDALRRAVRPGCTGLWQISSAASLVSTGKPQFDLFYLRRASVRFDVWIMVRTITMMLGLGRPVEIEDVPTWVRGSGLVSNVAVAEPALAVLEPVEAAFEPIAAVLDPSPTAPVADVPAQVTPILEPIARREIVTQRDRGALPAKV